MSTMKAAMVFEPNRMEIVDIDKPVIEDGEALIRVQYIGICGTDLHILHGMYAGAPYPLVPGHEFVGELVDIKGKEAAYFEIGDRVSAQMVLSCGHCTACAKGEDNVCSNLRMTGVHEPGGFAEYVKVPTKKLCKIPKTVDIQVAALTEPLAVAVHDVRTSGLKPGDTVLITGGGPIGMLIALVARLAGAKRVVISEMKEYRVNFAAEMGFDVLNPTDPDFEKKLKDLGGEEGFDVSFEVAGVQATLTTVLEHTKATGTVMIVAITNRKFDVETRLIFAKELNVKGVRIHNFNNFKGAIELLESPVLEKDLKKMISRVYPLEQINEAFDYALNGQDSFKVLVKIAD